MKQNEWDAPDPNPELKHRYRWGPAVTMVLWIAACAMFISERDWTVFVVTLFMAFLAGMLINTIQKKDER